MASWTDTLDRLRAICSVLALALALPASASAGQPFAIDAGGQNPHVAVGEDGTGHFVWESVGVESAVGYCQVPRGGTACTKAQRWPGLEGVNIEGPRVLLHHDGRIIILAGKACDRVALESEDGGATFSEPTVISSGCPGPELGFEAELGPGEDTVSYLLGGKFKAAPLGGPPTVHGYAHLGPIFDSGLAFLNPLTPIVALWDLDTISFRVYDGAGDYNDASNWSAPHDVAEGEEPNLAGGPRGVYLSYATATGHVISHYEAGTFTAPQRISDGARETRDGDRRRRRRFRRLGRQAQRRRPRGRDRPEQQGAERDRTAAARALQGAGRARDRDRARGLLGAPGLAVHGAGRRAPQRDRPERAGHGRDRRAGALAEDKRSGDGPGRQRQARQPAARLADPGGCGRDHRQRRQRGDLRRREGERGDPCAAGLGLDHAPESSSARRSSSRSTSSSRSR